MLFRTLSGRFLGLTIIFVMLAEVFILVPSVARFRAEYLNERLERAQIASLAVLASNTDMVDEELEVELLRNAEVLSIALRRDDFRELVLALSMPQMIEETFDMRQMSATHLIIDAARTLFTNEDRVIRAIGLPVKSGGQVIEATLYEAPLREAMVTYGRNILGLSLVISGITAAMLFFAVRWLIVLPISRVARNMTAFQENPEDARRVIEPKATVLELQNAEIALHDMQQGISSSLKQKQRLAQLGAAVAKVSHDLRNMLTTATLIADRLEMSDDPVVGRTAPKLVNSLDRAVNLCEQTLNFGKTEEAEPKISEIDLSDIVAEVIENEELRAQTRTVKIEANVPQEFVIKADREQVFRVLTNLTRNARQAIANSGKEGFVRIAASSKDCSDIIEISDNGPGLPEKAQTHLFKPFQGGTRREGTGLGLAIASELVRGHGGALELVRTGEEGSLFRITLPKAEMLERV